MVPEIDSHVRIGPPLGVVENEVARFESSQSHVLAHPALSPGVVRELDAEGFAIDVRDQAAAIETGLGDSPPRR